MELCKYLKAKQHEMNDFITSKAIIDQACTFTRIFKAWNNELTSYKTF